MSTRRMNGYALVITTGLRLARYALVTIPYDGGLPTTAYDMFSMESGKNEVSVRD